MCSIAGITNGGFEEVNKMLQSMAHRAPDDLGVYTDRSISLGMGRLSIIDLKSKNLCPYENNKIVLSFNGEVYNYKSLRSDLKKIGYTNNKLSSDFRPNFFLPLDWKLWPYEGKILMILIIKYH